MAEDVDALAAIRHAVARRDVQGRQPVQLRSGRSGDDHAFFPVPDRDSGLMQRWLGGGGKERDPAAGGVPIRLRAGGGCGEWDAEKQGHQRGAASQGAN